MIGSFKVETPSLVLALRHRGDSKKDRSRDGREPWRPLLSYLKQSGWKFVQEPQRSLEGPLFLRALRIQRRGLP